MDLGLKGKVAMVDYKTGPPKDSHALQLAGYTGTDFVEAFTSRLSSGLLPASPPPTGKPAGPNTPSYPPRDPQCPEK